VEGSGKARERQGAAHKQARREPLSTLPRDFILYRVLVYPIWKDAVKLYPWYQEMPELAAVQSKFVVVLQSRFPVVLVEVSAN